MKLSQLKIGDKITHYCYGELVQGTVIDTDGKAVVSRHKPMIWGNSVCTETWINPSGFLQATYQKVPTTPAAFYKGKQIKV